MNSVGGFGIANVDIIFGNADRIPKLGEETVSYTHLTLPTTT